jgi:sugar (pentulose or hexulose) kinase
MSSLDTVIGLDLGTTTAKALIRPRVTGPSPLVVDAPTTWTRTPDGGTEIDPDTLLRTAIDLIGRAVRAAERTWGGITVRAVSVTGLAESGVLLDPRGRPGLPAMAWFDTRGHAELGALASTRPDVAASYAALTGLPWSAQASFAKLLWLRDRRPVPLGSRWLSVPEWIVHALGGDQVREPSLASRTGLIEQRTGHPSAELLELAAVGSDLLPAPVPAGTPVGKLDHPDVTEAVGALLSVAGHDHPVAALAVDAVGIDDLFNSTGTADVLARAVAAPLSDEQRVAIVAAGWSAGAHIVPGVDLLLAGGSGGLLLRRVLAALGADTPEARERLDADSERLTELPSGLVVRGDSRRHDDVEIRLRDGATPAGVWRAATLCTGELAQDMLAGIAPTVGPHRRAVAAGGWTRMASVRTAKAAAIGALEFCDLREPGATGAALLAEFSLSGDDRSLTEFLHDNRRTTAAPDPEGPR